MLNWGNGKGSYDVAQQLQSLKYTNNICIFGLTEDKATIAAFRKSKAKVLLLDDGHHFNNNYAIM